MLKKRKHKMGNFVATPFRILLGAPVHAVTDFAKATIGSSKNVVDIQIKTIQEVQETLSEAGKRGFWYHKLLNIPLAGVGSVAKLFTGSIQAFINPLVNRVIDITKTGRNFVKNEIAALSSIFSSKPMSDFSFEKLKLMPTWERNRHPKNRLFGVNKIGIESSVTQESEKTQKQSAQGPSSLPQESSKFQKAPDIQKTQRSALISDQGKNILNLEKNKEYSQMKETIDQLTQKLRQQEQKLIEINTLLQQARANRNNNPLQSASESSKLGTQGLSPQNTSSIPKSSQSASNLESIEDEKLTTLSPSFNDDTVILQADSNTSSEPIASKQSSPTEK